MAISLKEQIKSVSKLFSEPAILKALLSQRHSGYLLEIGWFNSFKTKTPIDKFVIHSMAFLSFIHFPLVKD